MKYSLLAYSHNGYSMLSPYIILDQTYVEMLKQSKHAEPNHQQRAKRKCNCSEAENYALACGVKCDYQRSTFIDNTVCW